MISGGTFRGTVEDFRIGAREYTGSQITGGDFYGEVENNSTVDKDFSGITGGTFYGDLTDNSTGDDVQTWTVTYKYGELGGTYAEQIVLNNGTATAPAVPTKAGYPFDGWGPTIPTTITEDLTVKAKWTIKPCICEASCFPAGNAACPRCCDDNKLCELFKSPTDGSAFSNGDAIPVRWGLYSNIQIGDTISLDLLNEAGEKLSNWTSDKTAELNPSLHSADPISSLSAPGRYTLRCTLSRAGTAGSTQEVIRWETSLLLNGAAVFAKDKSMEYLSGMTVDVSELFLFAHTSSHDKISYTVTGGTGEGTLVENTLSITKPGTFSITATVDRDPGLQWDPKQDRDTAILTVNAFSITYDLDGGEVSGNPDYYSSKTPTFTLNAPTKSGYTFIGWSGTDLDGNENKTVTVTIGSTGDRTYTAHWTRNSSGGGGGGTTTYTLTFDTNGGSALSALRLARGSTVDLTQYVPERSGHVFTGWYADAALTQPTERVTLSASTTVYAGWRAETGELPFTDVGADAWYRDDVQYVYDKGLMTGMTADRFAPNEGMTRAMLVTVLWRQAGSPVVNYAMDFSDVAEGAWYAEAVRWATARSSWPTGCGPTPTRTGSAATPRPRCSGRWATGCSRATATSSTRRVPPPERRSQPCCTGRWSCEKKSLPLTREVAKPKVLTEGETDARGRSDQGAHRLSLSPLRGQLPRQREPDDMRKREDQWSSLSACQKSLADERPQAPWKRLTAEGGSWRVPVSRSEARNKIKSFSPVTCAPEKILLSP